ISPLISLFQVYSHQENQIAEENQLLLWFTLNQHQFQPKIKQTSKPSGLTFQFPQYPSLLCFSSQKRGFCLYITPCSVSAPFFTFSINTTAVLDLCIARCAAAHGRPDGRLSGA